MSYSIGQQVQVNPLAPAENYGRKGYVFEIVTSTEVIVDFGNDVVETIDVGDLTPFDQWSA